MRRKKKQKLTLKDINCVPCLHLSGLSDASRASGNNDSQSDSLSPLSSSSSGSSGDATKGSPEEELSDDNGGFVTPRSLTEQRNNKTRAVKRATVVGNPMFSNSPDSDEATGPGSESLGLDDLDMDYEQIMNYFDNLKVIRGDWL